MKTTPVCDQLSARGAQWGAAFGLEVPLWFASDGVKDEFSWRRSTDFAHVADEVRTVREPIWFGGAVRGWVTSGGYAHNAKASVAMGYVPKEIADASDGFEIELLGKRLAARIQPAPLFDANFARMRGRGESSPDAAGAFSRTFSRVQRGARPIRSAGCRDRMTGKAAGTKGLRRRPPGWRPDRVEYQSGSGRWSRNPGRSCS